MAKKKNYENDEAFRNFKLEDYLPSMYRREPGGRLSEPEQESDTESASLFPSLDEPDASAVKAAVSETNSPNRQEVQEADAPAERAVIRRISGKQRRLSLEEYRTTYLHVPKIINRKPVFVSETVRDELDRLVRHLGGKGMSASGLVENLVRLHLDTYRNDIGQWRKL